MLFRKLAILLGILMMFGAASGQIVNANRLLVKDSIKLKTLGINEFRTTLVDANHISLPTTAAVKLYVDSLGTLILGMFPDSLLYGKITPGYIPKASSIDSVLVNSLMQDDGSIVTIGGGLRITNVPFSVTGDTLLTINPATNRVEKRTKASLLSGYVGGAGSFVTNEFAYGASSTNIATTPQLTRDANRIFANTILNLNSYTTVGLPTLQAEDLGYSSTLNAYFGHNGTRIGYFPYADRGTFTANRVIVTDVNGQQTEDADITFVNGTTLQTSISGNIHAAVGRIASNVARCDSPEGGIGRVSGTGAIQINLPTGVFGGGGSLRQWAVSFEVVVTKYVGGGGQQQDKVVFVINGDNSPSIYQALAYSVGLGNNMQGLTWRAGISGAGGVVRVFLGELSSSLGTNVVSVENIVFASNFGTSASIGELCNGWAVALQSSSFGTVSRSGLVTPQYGRVYALSTDGLINLQRDVNAFHRARYQGNFNGAHEITLPPSTSNLSSLALPFQIKGGLVFGSLSNLYEFTIQGVYDYTSRNFLSCSVVWANGNPANLPVRFGDDGTSGKIWIGALNPPDAASTSWIGSFLYIYDLVTYNCSQAAHQDFYANFPALQTESTAFNNIDVTIAASSAGSIPYVSTYGHTYDANFFRNTTNFKAGNYNFNIDQSLGSGQNGYGLTWNNSTGEFEATSLYSGWNIQVNGGATASVASGNTLNLIDAWGLTATRSGLNITLEADSTQVASQYDLTQIFNFFTGDITQTGNRSHDAAGFSTTISGLLSWTLSGTGAITNINTGGGVQINTIRRTGSNIVAGELLYQLQNQGTVSGGDATFFRWQVLAMQNNTRASRINIAPARAFTFGSNASITTFALDSLYGEVKPVGLGHEVGSYPGTYNVPAQVFVNGRAGMDLFAIELNGDTRFLLQENGSARYFDYGTGLKTAPLLGKTRYAFAEWATDGTLMSRRFSAGSNITLTYAGDSLIIASTSGADGNGIYDASGTAFTDLSVEIDNSAEFYIENVAADQSGHLVFDLSGGDFPQVYFKTEGTVNGNIGFQEDIEFESGYGLKLEYEGNRIIIDETVTKFLLSDLAFTDVGVITSISDPEYYLDLRGEQVLKFGTNSEYSSSGLYIDFGSNGYLEHDRTTISAQDVSANATWKSEHYAVGGGSPLVNTSSSAFEESLQYGFTKYTAFRGAFNNTTVASQLIFDVKESSSSPSTSDASVILSFSTPSTELDVSSSLILVHKILSSPGTNYNLSTNVLSGTKLGVVGFGAGDASSNNLGATIRGESIENWASNEWGSKVVVSTVSINANTLTDRLTIDENGLTLNHNPTDNNALTKVLGRNSSTGIVEEIDVSTFGGGSGEANTGSNLGGGTAVFAGKVGVDLQFKSLVAGTNISLSNTSTEVTINAQNLASHNLTVTANRSVDGDGHNLSFSDLGITSFTTSAGSFTIETVGGIISLLAPSTQSIRLEVGSDRTFQFSNTDLALRVPVFSVRSVVGASSAAEFRLFEVSTTGADYVSIKSPSLSSSWTMTLPDTDGSADQLLKTDGSGVTSWVNDNKGILTASNDGSTIPNQMTLNAATNGDYDFGYDGVSAILVSDFTGVTSIYAKSQDVILNIGDASTIDLSGTGTFEISDSRSGGDDVGVRYSTVPTSLGANSLIHKGYVDSARKTIFTPSTGGTVTAVKANVNVINPSGTIATLTINTPGSPVDGDTFEVIFKETVTTITWGVGTVVKPITTAVNGTHLKLVYDSGAASWY